MGFIVRSTLELAQLYPYSFSMSISFWAPHFMWDCPRLSPKLVVSRHQVDGEYVSL
jgi:hypothetical protein